MKSGFFSHAALALTIVATSYALPVLQLDIADGEYRTNATSPAQNPETIVATSSAFTLYALVNSAASQYAGLNGYYLSAAITPKGTLPSEAFGSFSITTGGVTTTYSAGNNMVYGTPPLDATDIDPSEYAAMTGWTLKNDAKDLQSHGIFETMYAQIGFNFTATNSARAYNVEDDPGGFLASPTGTLLYQSFFVDITNLADEYTLHFDLFRSTGNKVTQFAPFSHDAESGPHASVPDAGSTLLLVVASIAMVLLWHQRSAPLPGCVSRRAEGR